LFDLREILCENAESDHNDGAITSIEKFLKFKMAVGASLEILIPHLFVKSQNSRKQQILI